MARVPEWRDSDGPGWLTEPGRRVAVHARESSYAATRAAAERHGAERALAQLEALLEPPATVVERVDVYLADGPGGLPAAPAGLAIARVLAPDAPIEPVAASLTRLVVPLWFGPAAGQAILVQMGIAGVVAARTRP